MSTFRKKSESGYEIFLLKMKIENENRQRKIHRPNQGSKVLTLSEIILSHVFRLMLMIMIGVTMTRRPNFSSFWSNMIDAVWVEA